MTISSSIGYALEAARSAGFGIGPTAFITTHYRRQVRIGPILMTKQRAITQLHRFSTCSAWCDCGHRWDAPAVVVCP